MAKRGSEDIDGFAYVQAMKRASERSTIKPKVHDSTDAERSIEPVMATTDAETPAVAPKRVTARVAVPTKRLVICYACGYSYTVAGKMHNSFCPKCKTKLMTEDVRVNGSQNEDILTIGNVEIAPGAVFAADLRVTGQNVVLDGDATPLKSIMATESLEIRSNARFAGVELKNITGKVIIAAGHEVVLDGGFTCEELTIHGRLRATVQVAKSAHIHEGGMLEGAFKGPSLLIDDGAGLVADVDLSPLYHAEPSPETKTKTFRRATTTLTNVMLMGVNLTAGLMRLFG